MTFEQGNLLHRLGIEREDPWVWVSFGGPITESGAAPRLQVDGPEGVPSTCPFPYTWSERWAGYEVLLIGVMADPWVLDNAVRATGLPWQWNDDGRLFTVELYCQRAQYHDAHLYAEYLSTPAERDGAIRGLHLRHGPDDRRQALNGMNRLIRFQGRPRGPTPEGEVDRWVQLARQIGREQARLKRKAELGPMYTAVDGRWWNTSVVPHLQKKGG